MHNLFQRTIKFSQSRGLAVSEMGALLRTVSYGMFNSMASNHIMIGDTTPQPDVRESGYLGIVSPMDSLRNQIRHVVSTEDEEVHGNDIDVCEPDIEMPFRSSSYLRDWVPDGCHTARAAIMAITRIIRIMLCNELGLKNHTVMAMEYANAADAANPFPSAWAILPVLTREIAICPAHAHWHQAV
ncbi:hypothetical protein E4U55_008162 [Claviceps digitariae]|nr:hypothetical protein E4U55_008162 [Claviceps digitariae]